MKKLLILTTFLVSACSGTMFGGNQNGGKIAPTPPAELPPSEFAGDQYSDSRGCLYIRSAVDGTSWIPRVTPKGSHLCNVNPTGRFDVGPGVADIHQNFAQPAPIVAPALPDQVESKQAAGGIKIGKLFDRIMGVESDTGVVITGPIVGLDQPAAAPTRTVEVITKPAPVAPAAPAQATQDEVVAQPAPVAQAPAPAPVVVEAPAPTPAPAPAPVVEAPAPAPAPAPAVVVAPAPAQATQGGRRVFTSAGQKSQITATQAPTTTESFVQIGTFANTSTRDAAVSALRNAGYSVTIRQAGDLSTVLVATKPGQTAEQLRQAMIASGFPDAVQF